MTEEEKLILETAGITITFIIIGYFIIWISKKSWEIYEKLYAIEQRVAKSQSMIELEECIVEIENIHLFHPSHHQEVQKIMEMIRVKMQYF